jgi:serine/threonine protein kinase
LNESNVNVKKYKTINGIQFNTFDDRFLFFNPSTPTLKKIEFSSAKPDILFEPSEEIDEQKIDDKITIYANIFLCKTPCILYKGFLEKEKKVALIKKFSAKNEELFNEEKDFLIQVKTKKNVSEYFLEFFDFTEQKGCFYIATEFANRSLEYYILNELNANIEDSHLLELLKNLLEKLKLLHEEDIVFGAMHPDDILLNTDNGKMKFKFPVPQNEFNNYNDQKHRCWSSLNLLQAFDSKKFYEAGEKDDVFSYGCIAYFVLTRGKYFYKAYRTLTNEKPDENQYVYLSNNGYIDFIKKTLDPDENSRAKILELIEHPIFWDSKKKLRFFTDVGDILASKKTDDKNLVKLMESATDYLEKNKNSIYDTESWMKKLPEIIEKFEDGKKPKVSEQKGQASKIKKQEEHDLKLKEQKRNKSIVEKQNGKDPNVNEQEGQDSNVKEQEGLDSNVKEQKGQDSKVKKQRNFYINETQRRSVTGLLHYIRNKFDHRLEAYPENIRNLFWKSDESYIEFYLQPNRFPNLLIITYNSMKEIMIHRKMNDYFPV